MYGRVECTRARGTRRYSGVTKGRRRDPRGKNDEDKEELDRRRKLWESRLKQREGKGTGERGP